MGNQLSNEPLRGPVEPTTPNLTSRPGGGFELGILGEEMDASRGVRPLQFFTKLFAPVSAPRGAVHHEGRVGRRVQIACLQVPGDNARDAHRNGKRHHHQVVGSTHAGATHAESSALAKPDVSDLRADVRDYESISAADLLEEVRHLVGPHLHPVSLTGESSEDIQATDGLQGAAYL